MKSKYRVKGEVGILNFAEDGRLLVESSEISESEKKILSLDVTPYLSRLHKFNDLVDRGIDFIDDISNIQYYTTDLTKVLPKNSKAEIFNNYRKYSELLDRVLKSNDYVLVKIESEDKISLVETGIVYAPESVIEAYNSNTALGKSNMYIKVSELDPYNLGGVLHELSKSL